MPPSGESWETYQGVVTGWGTQFFGGPVSDVLMEVVVPIWTHKRCKSAFTQRITDSVLCAGATEGGRDSCQGDSGKIGYGIFFFLFSFFGLRWSSAYSIAE